MSLSLPPRPNELLCAGQQCPDAGRCTRYLRPPMYRKDEKTNTVIAQKWASFDIERQHFGDCQAFTPLKMLGRELALR